MAEAKSHEGRVFFYYPGTSKKKPRRVVLAGIVRGDKILVAESILFPGKNPTLVEEQEVMTEGGPATAALILHDALPADRFNKKFGRALALDKCRGFYYNIEKTKPGVNYIEGTYKDEKGVVHQLTPIPCETSFVGSIDIPAGEELVGKLFVSEITKHYTPKPKVVKEVPKFTVEEVANYLKEWGVTGDVVGELNAENIRKANEPRVIQLPGPITPAA